MDTLAVLGFTLTLVPRKLQRGFVCSGPEMKIARKKRAITTLGENCVR